MVSINFLVRYHRSFLSTITRTNLAIVKQSAPDSLSHAQVKEGKKITGPEQLKDAAFGCARIRGDTLGIVGLGKFH